MDEIKETILKHNEKYNLRFIKKTHQYFIQNNLELISVTKKKELYFPFEKDKISRELALKNFSSQEEILSNWSLLAEYGSYIHDLADKYVNNLPLTKIELNQINHIINFFKENSNFEIIASEIKIFSLKYKIAGTIDLILRDKNNNKIYTLDWKTSQKEIEKNDIWQMAKYPFKTIPNNKFYQYSLQIWVYNLILKEEYGIEVYDSLIIHLKNDSNSYRLIIALNMEYEGLIFLKL